MGKRKKGDVCVWIFHEARQLEQMEIVGFGNEGEGFTRLAASPVPRGSPDDVRFRVIGQQAN
jgi:hypothetical protein